MKYALILAVFLLWTPASAETYNINSYIMICESNGDSNAINWGDAKFREDKRPSIGIYQWYWKSWVRYAKLYKVIPEELELNYKQAEKYLYDPVYSAAVAHGAIKDGLASRLWKNCYQKYLSYKLALNPIGTNISDG